MSVRRLKYGNTNTYLVGNLLVDTDMAGRMPALWREMKAQGIAPCDVKFVLATHYHPDHIGLIGALMQSGVRLLLPDWQRGFVHAADAICARDARAGFLPIDESRATVIRAEESRAFLAGLGIGGEIVPTTSHSADGAALILDDGNAFVGDLEPRVFLDGYADNAPLREDWARVLGKGAKIIHYGHANDEYIG